MERVRQRLRSFKLKITERIPIPVKRFAQTLQRYFIECCDNSNIHGLRYFTERTLNWSERLWWIIAVGLSLCWCTIMISDVWLEWDESPTKDDVGERTHISMIPFPTVTICPHTKNIKHKLNIASKFEDNKLIANLTETESAQLSAMVHICYNLENRFEYTNKFTSENIYKIIENVAPNVEYTFKECFWRTRRIECSEYISPIFTERGLCFTFNALKSYDMYTQEVALHRMTTEINRNLSGWSLGDGYSKEYSEIEYPFRVFESGRKGALELVLSTYAEDHDNMCIGSIEQGFRFSLSIPSGTVLGQNPILIDQSEDAIIEIKPQVDAISHRLRNFKPLQRRCMFSFERPLQFFKSYTYNNCVIECLANFTKTRCQCVPFYMPRDFDTKICGEASIDCCNKARYAFNSDFYSVFKDECNCWRSCTYVEYKAKVERNKLSQSTAKTDETVHKNNSGQLHTRLTIFFNEDQFETKTNVETLTWVDFLAICGGLLGVFLGVSFLSIIELVYYFSLRLFWVFYRPTYERSEDQSEQDEIVADEIRVNRKAFANQTKLLRFISDVRTFVTEFLDNSNIHGIGYCSRRMLHWSERLWWLVTFGVSLWFCSTMIHNVFLKWMEDPVTFTFHTFTNVKLIPFPTVTICPEIKSSKRIFDLSAALNSPPNLSDIEKTRLDALAHIYPRLPHLVTYSDDFANESIYDTIQEIVNIGEFMESDCEWYERRTCNKWLAPVLTEEGLCFTFNSLNSRDIFTDEMASGMMIVRNNPNISRWDSDNSYTNTYDEDSYPYSAFYKVKAYYFALHLPIYTRDIESLCKGCDMAFKLILNMPGETVDTTQNYLRLPISQLSVVYYKAKLTTTSDRLRSYTPNQRQCYFTFENPLRFFRIYTKPNCKAECLANFTRLECGCVKFSMPRDKHTKICGGAKVKCYQSAQINLFTTERGRIFHERCNCLPSCTTVEYNIYKYQRITAVDYQTHEGKKSLTLFLYSPWEVNLKIRKQMYNFNQLIAACGGLLGVFLGVSLLSIIEVIYYFTLRLFWYIKMKIDNNNN